MFHSGEQINVIKTTIDQVDTSWNCTIMFYSGEQNFTKTSIDQVDTTWKRRQFNFFKLHKEPEFYKTLFNLERLAVGAYWIYRGTN